MGVIFNYSELCVLLAETGATAPAGVEAAHFPPLNEAERREVLQAGRAKLSERENVEERSLVPVLAAPTAVLQAIRVQANRPDDHIWFFYTPSQMDWNMSRLAIYLNRPLNQNGAA